MEAGYSVRCIWKYHGDSRPDRVDAVHSRLELWNALLANYMYLVLKCCSWVVIAPQVLAFLLVRNKSLF